MKIYLDAMGGDNAPQAPAEGAREALERYEGLEIELAGPIEQVKAAVDAAFQGADPALRARLVLTDCPEVITNCAASTARRSRRFRPTARAISCSSTVGPMWTAAPNTCTSSP